MKTSTEHIVSAQRDAPTHCTCQRLPSHVYALKFSAWKKPIVEKFLQASTVAFVSKPELVATDHSLIVWGMKPINGQLAKDVTIVRLEDGFLRSVGLGADLVAPISWVADTRGIYYDASCESDLEHYLANYPFDDELLIRASGLRKRIVGLGVTKYNVGSGSWDRPTSASRVILVPGQVEDDASIVYGAPAVKKNLDLLITVRESNPDSYIVYKPHPDVSAGLRRRGESENLASNYCNEVVTDVPMEQMLKSIDEVHLMTSLTGFEALMRGVKVTCYGQPFYAGWGLTTDKIPIERRSRRLLLDELVAATLILYPTYISQVTGRYTSPERALLELEEQRVKQTKSQADTWMKLKRKILGLAALWRHRRQ